MDKVGIEIQLKQNLEQQLKTILPMLQKMDAQFNNINKTLVKMQDLHDKATRGFNAMGNSIDRVTQKEKALARVNNQVSNVGMAAKNATRSVDVLGASLGALTRLVAPLMILQKLTQGAEFLGGAGLDYEKTVRRLHMSRFSSTEQADVLDKARQYGASGKYAMSSNKFVDYALRAKAIMPTGKEAIESMELVGKMDMAMRKIGVEGSDRGDTGFTMAQIFEKLGDRTPAQQKETADLLTQYENYYAGQIPLQLVSTQIQRTRGAKLGADKRAMLGQLFHGISESIGSSGGSGGAGSVGTGYLAFDNLVSGNMSKQMIDVWREAGMFPGIEKYAKHHKGKGKHSTEYIDAITGKHVMYKGGATVTGAGSDIYNKDVLQNYLSHAAPDWYDQAASDQRGFMQGPMIAGMERYFHLKPGTFHAQSDVEQKRMIRKFLPGSKNTAQGQAIENIAGRYAQTVEQQQEGTKVSKNLDQTLDTATSIQDRMAQLTTAFESFGNALGRNENLVTLANQALNSLDQTMQILNNNVKPIGDFLAGSGRLVGAGMVGGVQGGLLGATNAIGNEAGHQLTGPYHDFLNKVTGKPKAGYLVSGANLGVTLHPGPVGALPGHFDPLSIKMTDAEQKEYLKTLSLPPRLQRMSDQYIQVANLANGTEGYSPWKNQLGTPSLKQSLDYLKSHFGEVVIQAIIPVSIGNKKIDQHIINPTGKALTKGALKSNQSGDKPAGAYTSPNFSRGGAGSQH
jgi:hypothetical protein